MARSNSILKRCEELARAGFLPEFEPGMTIGRGFADLGYEEFALLSESKIVSLYTGRESILPQDDRRQFFSVPSADEIVNEIAKRRFEIKNLEFKDQREWALTLMRGEEEIRVTSSSLYEVLIEGLTEILGK
ncbi:MAG: hypothetical protein J5J00_02335 [Deltaproteobacteria bacterium]|nr:hypothetical protein [Deltaproteobacteria bacterium]